MASKWAKIGSQGHFVRRKHRMRCYAHLFACALGLSIFSCCQGPAADIQDLIKPVNLTAGERDTLLISDLFYAKDYPLVFERNDKLSVQFRRERRELVLMTKPSFEGYTGLDFRLSGETYTIPIVSRIKQKQKFTFRPAKKPRYRMNLMGNFNDWNRTSLPMSDADGDGTYEIVLPLQPGQYLYQFVVDDKEIWDPQNPVKVDNGFGSYNSVVQVLPRHSGKVFLHVLAFAQQGKDVILKFKYDGIKENVPVSLGDILCLLDNQRVGTDAIGLQGDVITVRLPRARLGGQRVLRIVVTQGGQPSNLQTVRLVDGQPKGGDGDVFTWHDAVIYALMIDRFYDGDSLNTRAVVHDSLAAKANYMGGDLQGILTKLREGYFDSLGVNTFWLFPVNENTDHAYREYPPPHRYYAAYHGYWPVHHQRVETRFGDMALLRRVVAEAHARDMRVLLDFTANHVHEEHPFYTEHPNWFGTMYLPDGRKNLRLWDEHRLTTWFEPYLPSFDYLGSDEALETMTDNAIWWLRQTGADGFRHDAVKHIPNRFWRVLTRKLKQQIEIPESRRLFQIGETFGSYRLINSYVSNGQLNAQFNFNLYDTALYVFLNQDVNFQILARELQKTFSVYGVNHLMGNVMDSHDKVRYMAYADGDITLNSNEAQEIGWTNPPVVTFEESYRKAQLYLAYMLTIPGVPIIYYGDEIGMTGAADPDNRRMMRFGEALSAPEQRMLQVVSKLVHVRRRHSALRYGDFQTLQADERVFAHLRSDMRERILVALNKSGKSVRLNIELPSFYNLQTAEDLFTGERRAVTNNIVSFEVPANGFTILQLD